MGVLERLEASIAHASALLYSLKIPASVLAQPLRHSSCGESVAADMAVAAVRIQRCWRRHVRRSSKRAQRQRLTKGRRHVVATAAVEALPSSHACPRTPNTVALRGLLRIWAQRERRVNALYHA